MKKSFIKLRLNGRIIEVNAACVSAFCGSLPMFGPDCPGISLWVPQHAINAQPAQPAPRTCPGTPFILGRIEEYPSSKVCSLEPSVQCNRTDLASVYIYIYIHHVFDKHIYTVYIYIYILKYWKILETLIHNFCMHVHIYIYMYNYIYT